MFRMSEKILTVITKNYEDDHPLVVTVAVGLQTTEILMILLLITSVISELSKFFTKKKSANSSNLVSGLPPKDCSVSGED